MKDVLIRNEHRMRQMYAVLKRYGIGKTDKYNRGLWINKSDLPVILTMMDFDPSMISGKRNGIKFLFVKGASSYNWVSPDDFIKLFK